MDDVDSGGGANANKNKNLLEEKDKKYSNKSASSSVNEVKILASSRSKCNGRFTIVPVQEKLGDKLVLVRKKSIVKRILANGASSSKRPNQQRQQQQQHRDRANSTPSTLAFCQPVLNSGEKKQQPTSTSIMSPLPPLLVSVRNPSSMVNSKNGSADKQPEVCTKNNLDI